jgi:hypothetical protein
MSKPASSSDGMPVRQQRAKAHASRRRASLIAAALIATSVLGGPLWAESYDFFDPSWGANFISCAGEKQPAPLRAASPEGNIMIDGVITCRDDGDAFTYSIDYMNFALSPSTQWRSAQLQWFGSSAQRQGPKGRNDWFYDEAKPINVRIDPARKRASISNISFRVPKSVLAQARGFGFYAVGGGIFWPILLVSRDSPPTAAVSAPAALPVIATAPPSAPSPIPEPGASRKDSNEIAPPIARPEWGERFPTCAGARKPLPLKAATLDNEHILANGIVNCTDDGNAFVYDVDYMNFSLSASSKWPSAHLEWFGCGAQRKGADGRSDWIFEEAKPIKVDIKAGMPRVSITNVSCRVPKSVLSRARGFGFYVIGGGVMWSILLL